MIKYFGDEQNIQVRSEVHFMTFFHWQFQFEVNNVKLFVFSQLTDCHKPGQPTCWDMYQILQWALSYNMDKQKEIWAQSEKSQIK